MVGVGAAACRGINVSALAHIRSCRDDSQRHRKNSKYIYTPRTVNKYFEQPRRHIYTGIKFEAI